MCRLLAAPVLVASVFTTLLAALAASVAARQRPASDSPVFISVQQDLLGVPNSFSNAWGDYDNDGDVDLAVSLGSGEVRLYRNDKGTLVGVGAEVGMPQAGSHELRGLSWGDFDADGFLDLLGGSTPRDKLTVVLRNQGGRRFRDVAAEIGLTIPDRSARQTNWIDYDSDGDLDVYSTDRAGDNKLFQNTGGTFTHVFAGVGPTDSRPTVGACWLDIDNDGDLDLYLANQAGASDAVWRNDGSAFTDVAAALAMTGPSRTKDEGGVGCAIGDYDNDGDFDIFAPNYGHNLLYRNNNDGTFNEVGRALGVGVENHAVGADWGDYDNDGDLDLSVISYEGAPGAQTPLNALFRNDGAKGFVNVLTKDDPLNVADHGVQFVDYDNDGAIDLSVTDGYGPAGGHFVFRNALGEEVKRRSLSVLVLDAKGHFTRFGAEVRLFDRSGKILASRQVETGGGYNSQSATPVHFGLATTEPLTVEVTFMTRQGRNKQTVRNVRPGDHYGKSLVIREAR
jgi:FG-GAP-like repeat/ASPIC and UnbV